MSSDKIGSPQKPAANETSPLLPKSSEGDIPDSIFNLSNTIIGAGVLGLAKAFKNGGLLASIFIVIGVALLMSRSLRGLIHSSRLTGRTTYRDLVQATHGDRYMTLLDVCIFLQTFGGLLVYLIIIGDQMESVMGLITDEGSFWRKRGPVLSILTWPIIFPLALMRDLHSLRHASLAALTSILYVTVLVIVRAFTLDRGGSDADLANGSLDVVKAFPVIGFSLSCQYNLFPIMRELRDPTLERLSFISDTSLAFCASLYLIIGSFGYVTFGDEVDSNIIDSFREEDPSAVVARVLIIIVLVSSFPVVCYSCRYSLQMILSSSPSWIQDSHFLLTFGITGVAFILAIVFPDLDFVFHLTGSTVASMTSFIFPGLIHIKLTPEIPASDWGRIADVFMVSFGVSVAFVGTAVAFGLE